MKRLTYDFCIAGKHCWQVKGADNLECGEVCKSRDDEGCNGCPIANAFDRLAAIENILGDDYDIDRLRELIQADRDGRCIVPPAKIGDKVYHITTCENFKKVYDGTLYGDDGGPGTATGLYCPCELAETCPFPCDEDGWFDCYDHKNEIEIFEDVVTEIVIGDTLDYVGFEYSGAAEFEEFGKTVFITREAAEDALKAQKG